jgi:hypothetical protein
VCTRCVYHVCFPALHLAPTRTLTLALTVPFTPTHLHTPILHGGAVSASGGGVTAGVAVCVTAGAATTHAHARTHLKATRMLTSHSHAHAHRWYFWCQYQWWCDCARGCIRHCWSCYHTPRPPHGHHCVCCYTSHGSCTDATRSAQCSHGRQFWYVRCRSFQCCTLRSAFVMLCCSTAL